MRQRSPCYVERYLIINADDYGMCLATNEAAEHLAGIIELYLHPAKETVYGNPKLGQMAH